MQTRSCYKRVLQNVLNNSAKYKMADLGHCIIDVTSDDDFVYCVISDDGPGVPPESLERLMRPFYRVIRLVRTRKKVVV